MTGQKKSLLKRAIDFILNIGANPRDSDDVRSIKRIWYVASGVSLPASLLTGIGEFLAGTGEASVRSS
jgi:hypothetical protein